MRTAAASFLAFVVVVCVYVCGGRQGERERREREKERGRGRRERDQAAENGSDHAILCVCVEREDQDIHTERGGGPFDNAPYIL